MNVVAFIYIILLLSPPQDALSQILGLTRSQLTRDFFQSASNHTLTTIRLLLYESFFPIEL